MTDILMSTGSKGDKGDKGEDGNPGVPERAGSECHYF